MFRNIYSCLFGTGTAVLGNGMEGIGTTGIALAFGLQSLLLPIVLAQFQVHI